MCNIALHIVTHITKRNARQRLGLSTPELPRRDNTDRPFQGRNQMRRDWDFKCIRNKLPLQGLS